MPTFRPLSRRADAFVPTARAVEAPAPVLAENRPAPEPSPSPSPAPDPVAAARAGVEREGARVTEALRRAEALVAQLAEARRLDLLASADAIAEVVLALAERVVHTTLALDAAALAEVVRAAAEALPTDPVRVRVAPADVERLRPHLPEGLAAVIEADPTVDGGCVVESARASVDATLDAAREGLREAVHAWRARRTPR